MDEKMIVKGNLKEDPAGDERIDYEKPAAESVEKLASKTFGCEPCEHEHDGAGDRCSGL